MGSYFRGAPDLIKTLQNPDEVVTFQTTRANLFWICCLVNKASEHGYDKSEQATEAVRDLDKKTSNLFVFEEKLVW